VRGLSWALPAAGLPAGELRAGPNSSQPRERAEENQLKLSPRKPSQAYARGRQVGRRVF